MYCYQCGKEVGDVKFCPYCGAQLDGQTAQGTYQPINNQQTQYSQPGDEPSFGYALLSFFIPIVGIILFVVWNQEFPLRAKSCNRIDYRSYRSMLYICSIRKYVFFISRYLL